MRNSKSAVEVSRNINGTFTFRCRHVRPAEMLGLIYHLLRSDRAETSVYSYGRESTLKPELPPAALAEVPYLLRTLRGPTPERIAHHINKELDVAVDVDRMSITVGQIDERTAADLRYAACVHYLREKRSAFRFFSAVFALVAAAVLFLSAAPSFGWLPETLPHDWLQKYQDMLNAAVVLLVAGGIECGARALSKLEVDEN